MFAGVIGSGPVSYTDNPQKRWGFPAESRYNGLQFVTVDFQYTLPYSVLKCPDSNKREKQVSKGRLLSKYNRI